MFLKRFIQGIGGLLFLVGAAASLFMVFSIVRAGMFHRPQGSILIGLLVLVLVVSFLGAIALAGWRMFSKWTPSTIREYAFIQALLTGVAVGHLLYPRTNLYAAAGWVTAALFAHPLCYIIRHCLEQTGNYPDAESEIKTFVPTLPKRWF